MAIVKVGDVNIYYEVQGKGEPLVLIPPFTSHSVIWSRQVPFFSQDYRVITLDNRGSGRSDKTDPPYSIEMMTGDLAQLLESVGVKAAHIFGLSMGGNIAQQFALTYPDKVMSLILGSTFASCCGPYGVTFSAEAMSFLFDMERRKNLKPEELGKEQLQLNFSQAFINYISNNPVFLQRMMVDEYTAPLHGVTGQSAAIRSFDIYQRLPEIKAPTLVIAGSADKLVPAENAQVLASRIPNAELVILKNAGHVFIIEAAEEVNKIVQDFLRRHQGGR